MAITKNYLNEMFGIVLVLSALLSTVSAIDCNGKSFHCVNSTHFMICVDLGGGVSQAMDNYLVPCPPPTVCQGTNHFECEFLAPTTQNNIISETTQPWEEVVTVSSIGNTTKEFSENYINTERITTTAEYSVTTDTTVDLTTATASELYVNNIPEIIPTSAAEIATVATETTQTLNENPIIIEYVPTEVAGAITTAVTETLTQTAAESKNLTETGPVIIGEITTMAAETTTENIILTDTVAIETGYIAPSAAERIPQAIHENLNITEAEPTGVAKNITITNIETVTQFTTESENSTKTEHVVVDEITATTTETTADNIVITEPLGTQTTAESKILKETGPVIVDVITTTENIIMTDTVAAETGYSAPSATEQVQQPLHEKLNITETEPTGVAKNITTTNIGTVTQYTTESENSAKTEHVVVNEITATTTETTTDNIVITEPLGTQTKAESKNLKETGPLIVDEITTTVAETTTENIIMTDNVAAETRYNATSATEQVPQAKHEKLNITQTETTGVAKDITTTIIETVTQYSSESGNSTETEYVGVDEISATTTETITDNLIITEPLGTQTTAESINLTETGHVIIDEITTTAAETTTVNIIMTDTVAAETGYIEPTHRVIQSTNDNFLELETAQSKAEPPQATILLQNSSVTSNTLLKEPSIDLKNPLNIEKPSSSTASNITESNLNKVLISETKNASKTDSVVQNILLIQTTATAENTVETATGSVEHLTTIPVNSITDDFTTAPPLDSKIKESEIVNVSEPSKPLTSFDGNVQPNASIVGNKNLVANEIENQEIQINDPVPQYNNTAARNRTEKLTNTTDERVVVSNINSKTLPAIVTTDVPYVYNYAGTENNLYTTTDKSLQENKYTTVTNVPTENTLIITTNAQNPAVTTVLDATWTEMIDNEAGAENPTTINEGKITPETTQNVVTDYIIVPTSEAVNLEIITTDVVPTTVSDVQSMPPTFEDNDAQLPVTENIVSTITNGVTTNGSMTVESVNMDIITTKAVDIPVKVSKAHPTPTAFEDNMKIETSLPVTENIVSTVNNQVSTNGFMTGQAVNMNTITTEAVGVPTDISNTQSMLLAFEDNMKIKAQFGNALAPATEDMVSSANNKVDTNDFMNAQASDLDTITTDAIYKLTTVTNGQTLDFVDIIKTEAPLPPTENIVFSVNNGDSTNGFMTVQPVNVDIINTEATYGAYTTVSNSHPMRGSFVDNITTDTPLPATENIISSVNYEVNTNDFTTAQSVNVDEVYMEATNIPTTISNVLPKAPTIEDNMTINVPLTANENQLTSVNNGASTNMFMTTPAVHVDIKNTLATVNNASAMAPDFDGSTTTETPLSATMKIVSAINKGVSTNSLTTAKPITLGQITQKTELETVVQLTTESYTVPSSKVIQLSLNNETTVKNVNGDIITAESGTPVTDIPKASPNNAIQNTQTIISGSANTAMESHVKENYEDNKMTTIATNHMIEATDIRGQHLSDFSLSSKNTPASGLAVDESTSHVSQIENVNEQAPVYNDDTSQKEASPIKDNITQAATRKSIPAFGFVSALDISNQNLMNPQVESKKIQVTNNLQPSTVERNDQTDNIISNPLANQVFNNLNQNSESIGSSVTNINIKKNDRDATRLSTENISQQATTTSVSTGSPIYAHIDHGQSIDSITTQSFIGVTSSNDLLATKGHSENIAKVNSDNETNYQPKSQPEIPITISSNQKTDKLATAEVNVLSMSTTLPAKTSVADSTILDSLKNTMDNSFSPSSGSTVVETDNALRKSGNKTEVFLDHKENINVKSNQDPSIISISIISDKIPEVKSSVIIGGKNDSLTVPHNNEFILPTNSHGSPKATGVVTHMEENKINEEDDTLSKSVILDVLPLPINNIQFNVPTTNVPALTDFISNSQAENTVIITESYKSATSRTSFVETKDSYKLVNIPSVPRKDPTFNFQLEVNDRTSDTTTVPTVGSSTFNSHISVLAKTVARNGNVTLNSQTKSIDEANVLSQPSHVEKIPNKKTSAPNNATAIPDIKPSGSGTNTDNLHNIHSTTTSDNVNTGLITPESVSNYKSQSVNLRPQESVSSRVYQKNNLTVVTNVKSASQNISFNTEKAPQKSIGSDNMQSGITHQNNSSTTITSSQPQEISTSTARTPSQVVTPNTISHVNNNLNKQVPTDAAQTFVCINGVRGRYSDKDDCRKFYICIGNNEPVIGYCPENTVFSDLKKLCTKNMSHCIRENQFKCPSAGRFSDFMKDNVYYICINHNTKLYRFKFQCQKGYILDKTTVHCIETKEIESNESVSISSSDNSSQTSSSAISSSTSSKSISTSSKSNSHSKPDSSSKNDNSSNSKKSNEAVEMSEKSEDNDDDDDDEVFKCKKEGKFPIRNECRRYYLCKKNRKREYRRKIKKCNSGKVFHKDKKKCVDDDSYEC